jgi:hypothetical protein
LRKLVFRNFFYFFINSSSSQLLVYYVQAFGDTYKQDFAPSGFAKFRSRSRQHFLRIFPGRHYLAVENGKILAAVFLMSIVGIFFCVFFIAIKYQKWTAAAMLSKAIGGSYVPHAEHF